MELIQFLGEDWRIIGYLDKGGGITTNPNIAITVSQANRQIWEHFASALIGRLGVTSYHFVDAESWREANV